MSNINSSYIQHNSISNKCLCFGTSFYCRLDSKHWGMDYKYIYSGYVYISRKQVDSAVQRKIFEEERNNHYKTNTCGMDILHFNLYYWFEKQKTQM